MPHTLSQNDARARRLRCVAHATQTARAPRRAARKVFLTAARAGRVPPPCGSRRPAAERVLTRGCRPSAGSRRTDGVHAVHSSRQDRTREPPPRPSEVAALRAQGMPSLRYVHRAEGAPASRRRRKAHGDRAQTDVEPRDRTHCVHRFARRTAACSDGRRGAASRIGVVREVRLRDSRQSRRVVKSVQRSPAAYPHGRAREDARGCSPPTVKPTYSVSVAGAAKAPACC